MLISMIVAGRRHEVTPTILEVTGLYKFFGGLAAVAGVDFHLEKGEIMGLIGPNGSGKTTVFNLIAGVFKPDRGSIKLEGQDITGASSAADLSNGYWENFSDSPCPLAVSPFLKMLDWAGSTAASLPKASNRPKWRQTRFWNSSA